MNTSKMLSEGDTEALLMGVLESSLDPMFIINEKGIIEIVNNAAVDLFGWSEDDFLGQNISMIAGAQHGEKHDQYIAQYLRTGKAGVMGKKRELTAIKMDGSEFTIELGLTEVKLQSKTEIFFCGFVRDLTRQKMDEERVRHNQKFLNDLIESSFDALFAIEKNGTILKVNEAAVKEFGWSREELLGSNISMIMTDNDAKNHHKFVARYLETRKKKMIGIQRELVAKRKDQSTFPVFLGLQEIKDLAGDPMFVSYVRNLSDQKKIMNLEREKAIAEILLKQSVPDNVLEDDSSRGSDDCDNSYLISTVLYGEFEGTASFDESHAEEAKEILRSLYATFDSLVDKYHLAKVKTKGACCMVMTLPVSEFEEVECANMCYFGLDILDTLRKHNEKNPWYQIYFRAGVASGPVVSKNTLWVDAVNLSKMKQGAPQNSLAGNIRVPAIIVDMLCEEFNFSPGGKFEQEGKRDLETFLLTSCIKMLSSTLEDRPEENANQPLLRGLNDFLSTLVAKEQA